jgi:hypothetical protein
MMNDTDLASRVRESVSEIQLQTPVESIIKTADRRRRTRHIRRSAAAIAGCAAIALAALSLTSGSPTPAGTRNVQLAAFTLSDDPADSTSLTLHKGAQYRLDPDALRNALAGHGIPALVTVGTYCDTNPEPPGLDQVVTAYRQASGDVFLKINPAAIPAGAELSIGYFPAHTRFSLIEQNAPKNCSA